MRNRVKLIEDELLKSNQHKEADFTAVLNQYRDYQLTVAKYLKLGGSSLLLLTVFTGFYFSQIEPKTEASSDEVFSDVMYPQMELIDFEAIAIPIESSTTKSKSANGANTTVSSLAFESDDKISGESIEAIPTKSPEKSLLKINRNAAPLFGFEKLYEHFSKNISYDRLSGSNSLGGVVKVRFTVNPDGTIANPDVIESISPEFDQEAMRLIAEMPNWRPAIKNGVAISQSITIPIRFEKLDN